MNDLTVQSLAGRQLIAWQLISCSVMSPILTLHGPTTDLEMDHWTSTPDDRLIAGNQAYNA